MSGSTSVTPAIIRRAGMDLLARREHSQQELFNKLAKRFPDDVELITVELQKLEAEGLQSDLRMVEAFIRSRVNRGQGPVKIAAELRGKGIPEDMAKSCLQNAEVDWFSLIEDVAYRKYGDTKVDDLREKGRRTRFLQQRGFSFDQISTLLG